MAGTRWRLLVRQTRPPEVGVAELKAAIGRLTEIAVTNVGPDTVVSIDYDDEALAREAQGRAQAAAFNALCVVEEFPLPG